MTRDAVLRGPSAAEVVALARVALSPDAAPPPHLRQELEENGWMTTNRAGDHVLTISGRTLVHLAQSADLANVTRSSFLSFEPSHLMSL